MDKENISKLLNIKITYANNTTNIYNRHISEKIS